MDRSSKKQSNLSKASVNLNSQFFLHSKLLSNVLNTKYHNITISDHSPGSICLDFNQQKQQTAWRFCPYLINDSGYCKYLASKVDEFSDANDTLDTSDSNLWETFKVVMRGHVMSYGASLKKMRNARLLEIDSKLSQLETQYKQNDNNQTLQEIINLRYEYNTILTKQVSEQLSRLRSRYFELGDKPHPLLARQRSGLQNSKAIHQIRSANGDLLTHPKLVNKRIMEFYKELYSAKAKGDVDLWLKSVPIPKLSGAAKEALNAAITIDEVTDPSKSFCIGKAPGPDSFSLLQSKKVFLEFYKKCSKIFSTTNLCNLTLNLNKCGK